MTREFSLAWEAQSTCVGQIKHRIRLRLLLRWRRLLRLAGRPGFGPQLRRNAHGGKACNPSIWEIGTGGSEAQSWRQPVLTGNCLKKKFRCQTVLQTCKEIISDCWEVCALGQKAVPWETPLGETAILWCFIRATAWKMVLPSVGRTTGRQVALRSALWPDLHAVR